MLKREFLQRITKSTASPEPTAKDAQTFELTNLRVEEVSLVDSPANQRVFLVKKRDAKADEETTTVAAGDLEDLSKAEPGESKTVRQARPRVDSADDRARRSTPDLAAVEAARRKIAKREAEEAQIAADVARERELAEGVTTKQTDPEPPKKDSPEDEPATTTTETVETKETVQTETKPKEVALPPEEKTDDVAKVGRPMQRARLDRLKASVKALSEMIGELEVADAAAEEPAAKAAGEGLDMTFDEVQAFIKEVNELPAQTRAVISVEKGRLKLNSERVSAPAKLEPDPTVAASLKKATDGLEKSDGEIRRLAAVVQALQTMVKEQGEQLAKSRLPVNSNAISLEKANSDHDKVSWGLDLASPVRRIPGRTF
jgi:hypothetical protein